MKRSDFIKICGILGVSLPFQSALSGCGEDDKLIPKFKGKIIIIGAGSGGMSAGYLLQQLGIDFQILEASSSYGGRIKINTDFADFPIPLGAEWIETDIDVFQTIVNDSTVKVNIETFQDKPDYKFVNSSWFNFFETYIVPSIADKIVYNTVVQSIDYTGEQAVVETKNGQYTADKVIVSVPLKILQKAAIEFKPSLPQAKQAAIDRLIVWDGFKAFIEFSNQFYEEGFEKTITPVTDGETIYYDATYGQKSSKKIIGLFAVGKPAAKYISLTDVELKDFMLSELDGVFANQATPNYLQHISQNWNKEPFVQGGYLADNADWKTVKILSESVAGKIYFAGSEYTDGEDWVSVHTAAQSARAVVKEINL